MRRSGLLCGALASLALSLAAPAYGDTEPTTGAAFHCDNGSKLVLSFVDSSEGFAALIWVQGVNYKLAYRPPEAGPPQIVWSDGENSLTWSPGVRLMWMSGSTHLMCGRSHKH